MSYPGHIRHFDPNYKNNRKFDKQGINIDENQFQTINPKGQSTFLLLFQKLKVRLLTFLKSFFKKKSKFSPEMQKYTKTELKQKYLSIIKEQKAKGFFLFEWVLIPVTWLEWKLTNKHWIIKRSTGLFILIISIFLSLQLDEFLNTDRSFWSFPIVAIGVPLNMLLSFVALVGLGLTFMKWK